MYYMGKKKYKDIKQGDLFFDRKTGTVYRAKNDVSGVDHLYSGFDIMLCDALDRKSVV